MSDPSPFVDPILEAVRRAAAARARAPRATYRVQFEPGIMTFREAERIIPYLRDLGISDLYASPCRKTRSGCAHGYAIVDYNALNPELGTPEDHEAMIAALREAGMGQILDIVPNHMSIAPGENLWWTDVLENGPSSPYAPYFDIEWDPAQEELKNRILLPMLGQQYGEVLESGQLRLEYRDGAFYLRCYDAPLPIDPKTYPQILARGLDRLKESIPADSEPMDEWESILTALEHLPDRSQTDPDHVRERQREKELIKKRLCQLSANCPAIADFVAANLAELNGTPGTPDSFDELDRLLDAQVYRLVHWKASGDEINYRRFFDINELAAICTEDPAVFEKSHRLVFEMLARGAVAGLRIDHIDGLFDPTDYLRRLQHGYLRVLAQEAWSSLSDKNDGSGLALPAWSDMEPLVCPTLREMAEHSPPSLFVVVEKILGPEEPLPKQWPVDGTTGYDFLRSVNGVFVDWDGIAELAKVWERFTDIHNGFRDVVYESKRSILRAAMSSELQLLAQRLNRLSERHRRFRDFTLNSLRHALREIIAYFPVYRTYVRPQEVPERDRLFILGAIAMAERQNPEIPQIVFDFVRDVLFFEQPASLDAAGLRERELFVGRFQQVTSPVMAKGVEDTAFYRHFPLVSLNEVGDEPDDEPLGVDYFHHENAARHADWPHSLLCTTSHDTKRSEDVRARINVLSEIPHDWARAANRWARINRQHRREADGWIAPSRSDEYLFYQTLVGVWPLEPPDAEAHAQLVARLQAYMEKAAREAKLHTSWLNPRADYEAALRDFVAAALANHPKNRFLPVFRAFQQRIVGFGLCNAIAQLVLKLTSPGVPDIYQGQELWDFSLVDPDNRRPVDFTLRQRLLAELQDELAGGRESRLALATRLAARPVDPKMKLFVTWQTLQFRRDNADLFQTGRYVPVAAVGRRAVHVCAFAWQRKGEGAESGRKALVVVPRLVAGLAQAAGAASENGMPLGPAVWDDTSVILPLTRPATFTNLFTGKSIPAEPPTLCMADILSDFPVAVLIERGAGDEPDDAVT